jgi:hypothetical protein
MASSKPGGICSLTSAAVAASLQDWDIAGVGATAPIARVIASQQKKCARAFTISLMHVGSPPDAARPGMASWSE